MYKNRTPSSGSSVCRRKTEPALVLASPAHRNRVRAGRSWLTAGPLLGSPWDFGAPTCGLVTLSRAPVEGRVVAMTIRPSISTPWLKSHAAPKIVSSRLSRSSSDRAAAEGRAGRRCRPPFDLRHAARPWLTGAPFLGSPRDLGSRRADSAIECQQKLDELKAVSEDQVKGDDGQSPQAL